jgi:hypothetical protein
MEDAPITDTAAAPAPAAPADPHPVLTELENISGETLQFLVKHGPLLVQIATDIAGVAGGGIGAILPILLKNLPTLVAAL